MSHSDLDSPTCYINLKLHSGDLLLLPLNFTNWSLGIPHVSLTINAIFIVLKRGNPVALMRKKDTPASLGKDKKTLLVNPALLSPGQPTRDWWWLVRVRPVKQPRNSFQTDLTAEQTSADLLPAGGSAICQIWGQI